MKAKLKLRNTLFMK